MSGDWLGENVTLTCFVENNMKNGLKGNDMAEVTVYVLQAPGTCIYVCETCTCTFKCTGTGFTDIYWLVRSYVFGGNLLKWFTVFRFVILYKNVHVYSKYMSCTCVMLYVQMCKYIMIIISDLGVRWLLPNFAYLINTRM